MKRLSRILVTCNARLPSVELAAIIPLSELQKRGLCIFRYKDEPNLSVADIGWCDILFVLRGTSQRAVWAAKEAKRLGRLVLGYWDDDFLSIPVHNSNYAYYASAAAAKSIGDFFRLADAFFSPSVSLAAKLSDLHGREATVLPVPAPETLARPKPRNNAKAVIGFAGSMVYTTYLDQLVGPALSEVAAANDFKLHIVGPTPRFVAGLPIETIHTEWIQDYYRYLSFAAELGWDIGLAPQIDCEFTTHKFYNKVLEYANIGCAGVYSRLEPYSGVVQDEITGLLVQNEIAAWKDAIQRLIKDQELRSRIAENAFQYVQENHSIRVVAAGYATALAPYLSHRAPTIHRTYVLTPSLVFKLSSTWRLSLDYVHSHGVRRFIWAAARHGFYSVWRTVRRLRS